MTKTDLRAMARVLQAAAIATSNNYDLTEWNTHVGHNNLWYSGFRRWVANAGLIKTGAPTANGCRLVAISSTVMESNGAFAKLQKCHEAGSCLQRSPIPRTLGEYKDVSEHCQSLLSKANPVGLNKESNYSIPWVIRSHFFAELRSRGIPALKMDDTSVRDILRCFPDSSGWLMELWQKKGLQTLKDVCDHLNYNHPPELLTMYMCIFGEKSILKEDLSTLKKNSALLKRARVEGFRASGVVAVPAVLIKRCVLGQ